MGDKTTRRTKAELLAEMQELENTVRDFKKAKRLTARTLNSLRSFEKAFETMQLGVTICDLNGKIIYTNPAEAEMHGYTVKELIGKDARIFAPPTIWRPMKKEKVRQLTRWKRESINMKKNGKKFPVQIMSDAVTDEKGKVIAIIATCEDITERREAEREKLQLIEKLEEALGRVKTLSGMLPICASCKSIRDDAGYWNKIEDYIHEHSDAEFTHGLCPACVKDLYQPVKKKTARKKA